MCSARGWAGTVGKGRSPIGATPQVQISSPVIGHPIGGSGVGVSIGAPIEVSIADGQHPIGSSAGVGSGAQTPLAGSWQIGADHDASTGHVD